MQDLQNGAYVYVTAPNYEFRKTHGTIGRFERADEASSLIWIKFEKDQQIHAVEPEFIAPIRKRDEFASYKGEKVVISQPILQVENGEVTYLITYPDYARGGMTVEYSEISDWVDTPDEIIADLTEQLYQASKEVDRYKNMYTTDMAHWEKIMRDVKEREMWCDEGTNAIIGELNQGFVGWQLDYYEQDFEIEVEVTATISTTVTVVVSAASQELAAEYIMDSPESYFNPTAELEDAVSDCDYDVEIN